MINKMPGIHTRSVFLSLATGLLIVAAALAITRTRLSAQPRGKAVYDKHCTECHGPTGKGDGPGAFYVAPRPRDFSTGRYKIRSTETGSVPTDEDLVRSVRQGLYGTAMPGWDRILSDTDIQDVVAYIKSLSPQFATPPTVVMPGDGTPSSPESIARGVQAYEKLQCGKCHGSDGRGTGAVTTEFQDDWNQPLPAADLTQPWTFRGGATSRDVYLRFRTGMAGTPMPSFAEAASDAEMWDLSNYIVSLARKPIWSMTAQEVADHYAREEADAKASPVKRGAYLVNSLGCVLCHSPVDEERRMMPGMRLAGGVLFRIEPFGDFTTGNLTSDKETGLGNWTDDEIKRVITKGTLRDGTRLLPFPMDYAAFGTMKPSDIDAIVAYLRTVPPVSNRVPPPRFKFFPSYLWGKFKLLILGDDPPMAIFPGNAGTKGGWAMKKFLKWTLLVVAVLAVCALGAFLYFIPPFFSVAPEEFTKAAADAAPPVSTIADPAQRAIAERGRYLVVSTGCIGCHATNGPQGPDLTKYLAGGAIMSRTKDATYVSRNLTPDKETGLGRRTRRRGQARAQKRRVSRRPHRADDEHAVGGIFQLDGRRSSRRRRVSAKHSGDSLSDAGAGAGQRGHRSGRIRPGARVEEIRRRGSDTSEVDG